MYRLWQCILEFGAVAIILLSATGSHAQKEPEPIIIGVSTALSGGAATYGQDIRDAVFYAAGKLGRKHYRILIEDDRCDPKTAVSIAHKFVNIDHVVAVIGPACSGSVLSAAPIYEKAKVLVMVTNASSPAIADAGDYIFRTQPSDQKLSELIINHISTRHAKLGILSEETEYAQTIEAHLLRRGNAKSLEIIREDYYPETSDFKPLILKLKRSGIDSLYINSQNESSFANILKQIRGLQWFVPVFGAYWPGSPSLLEIAKTEAEGVVYADTPSLDDILNVRGRSLFREYKAKFGTMRSTESVFATTFEGFRALHLALHSGTDPRQFLYTSEFNGIFGPYRFDENGEIDGLDFSLKVIKNGVPVALSNRGK